MSAVTFVAETLVLALRWRINLLSLGEVDARVLGINVDLLRWCLMGLVALMVAAQVSVIGGVGWVGLIVPHLARPPGRAGTYPPTADRGGPGRYLSVGRG